MRIRLVSGHNPGPFTGKGSNTWFIDGHLPTLIDTGEGTPEHLEELEGVLREAGTGLGQVLVTHAHPDHAGGASRLASRWPQVEFAKYPWPEQDQRFGVAWTFLEDDQIVPAGDASLWVLHTPGHAPDHLCFFEPTSGTLFAGDLVINGGTVVIPASQGGSLSDYLRSLTRILELQPRRILAGHGVVIEHPAALLRGYLVHRQAHEREIIESLRAGPAPITAIVARVYANLSSGMETAAGQSVLAHLRKLEGEGRARPEEEGDPFTVPWRLL